GRARHACAWRGGGSDHRCGHDADGGNAQPRRQPGDGQPTHPRAAAERPQSGGPAAVSARRGTADGGACEQCNGRQQRRSGVFARRRPVVWRGLRARRRHAQRPAEQSQHAAAVPRRVAGVPGGTNALTAQNGMHSAGSVNAVTKSGTNAFRGDLFEFLRHHSFNATDPFGARQADGSRKDDGLKRNQYGATLGGPISPDQLFFFFGYQGTNTRVNPTDNRAFVPTPAMLAGDFTAFASPACNAGVQRNLLLPFVNNRISPALFSKAALNITSKLPTTSDPCGLVQYGLPSASDEGQYVTKVDFTINNAHSLFGRYIATTQFSPPPYTLESAQQ